MSMRMKTASSNAASSLYSLFMNVSAPSFIRREMRSISLFSTLRFLTHRYRYSANRNAIAETRKERVRKILSMPASIVQRRTARLDAARIRTFFVILSLARLLKAGKKILSYSENAILCTHIAIF